MDLLLLLFNYDLGSFFKYKSHEMCLQLPYLQSLKMATFFIFIKIKDILNIFFTRNFFNHV